MKKITLILAMMMIVMSAMADGPTYSFMKGGRGQSRNTVNKNRVDLSEVYDIKYNSNTAVTAAMDFDAVNKPQTAPRSIFRFGMGESVSASAPVVSGGVAASSGIRAGERRTATTTGSALSVALFNGKKGNDITLGQNGHLALFGDDIKLMDGEDTDPNAGEFETPRVPLGDAMLPLLMMIMAFAGFVYFRRK